MRRVLLIAYQFPPFTGSSGVQRAFRFACYLRDFDWEPVVLTVHPRAFEHLSGELLEQLPDGITVVRAPAWDARRHFSIGGRYPGFLARPDRWRSWWPGAIFAGLSAIRRYKPDAMWSTFPIATAHSIGVTLAKLSSLPWIADFRDPMAQDGYPADPATWRSYASIERQAVSGATFSSFTASSAVELYKQRYPEFTERFVLIENGYDESSFVGVQDVERKLNPGFLTLLHSGVIYPSERDPVCLFKAIGNLKTSAPEILSKLIVRFRAAAYDDLLHELGKQHNVSDHIEVLPPISHKEAVREICRADGLLIAQAANCNAQIPAKFYEYMRAGRPILTLADPAGDTARAAVAAGLTAVAPLNDAVAIRDLLERFISAPNNGTMPDPAASKTMSRYARTRQLADLLELAVSNARG